MFLKGSLPCPTSKVSFKLLFLFIYRDVCMAYKILALSYRTLFWIFRKNWANFNVLVCCATDLNTSRCKHQKLDSFYPKHLEHYWMRSFLTSKNSEKWPQNFCNRIAVWKFTTYIFWGVKDKNVWESSKLANFFYQIWVSALNNWPSRYLHV